MPKLNRSHIDCTRGFKANLEKFGDSFGPILFSSWLRPTTVLQWLAESTHGGGHAMLTPVKPGSTVPLVRGVVPVELNNVHVTANLRGKGYGKLLVRECLAFARRHGWPVVARPLPYGRGAGMDSTQLAEWYAGLGFGRLATVDGNDYWSIDYRR